MTTELIHTATFILFGSFKRYEMILFFSRFTRKQSWKKRERESECISIETKERYPSLSGYVDLAAVASYLFFLAFYLMSSSCRTVN